MKGVAKTYQHFLSQSYWDMFIVSKNFENEDAPAEWMKTLNNMLTFLPSAIENTIRADPWHNVFTQVMAEINTLTLDETFDVYRRHWLIVKTCEFFCPEITRRLKLELEAHNLLLNIKEFKKGEAWHK